MKKLISLLICFFILFSLVACNKAEQNPKSKVSAVTVKVLNSLDGEQSEKPITDKEALSKFEVIPKGILNTAENG